jgi:hypothetical protein
MKKIILLALVAIVGCTAIEVPKKNNSCVNKFRNRTIGSTNGYTDMEVVCGRPLNWGGNYKRILVHGVRSTAMTKYAYDHKVTNDGIVLNIMWFNSLKKIIKELDSPDITGAGDDDRICVVKDYDFNLIDDDKVYLNADSITMLTKFEADAYLKEHTNTKIFKKA